MRTAPELDREKRWLADHYPTRGDTYQWEWRLWALAEETGLPMGELYEEVKAMAERSLI